MDQVAAAKKSFLGWWLLIAGILVISSVVVIRQAADNAKKKEQALLGNIEEIQKTNRTLDEEKKLSENAFSQMTIKLAAMGGKINELSRELAAQKQVNDKTRVILRQKNTALKNSVTAIDVLNRKKRRLIQELDKVQQDCQAGKEQLAVVMKKNDMLENRIKDLVENEKTSLGTIIIKPASK